MNDDHVKECRVNNKLDCFGAIWNDYCRHKPRNSASICPTTKSRNRKQPLIYCWIEGWTLTIKELTFLFLPLPLGSWRKSCIYCDNTFKHFCTIFFIFPWFYSEKPKIFCHLLTICMVSLPLIMGVCFHNFNLNWIQWNWWKRWSLGKFYAQYLWSLPCVRYLSNRPLWKGINELMCNPYLWEIFSLVDRQESLLFYFLVLSTLSCKASAGLVSLSHFYREIKHNTHDLRICV